MGVVRKMGRLRHTYTGEIPPNPTTEKLWLDTSGEKPILMVHLVYPGRIGRWVKAGPVAGSLYKVVTVIEPIVRKVPTGSDEFGVEGS